MADFQYPLPLDRNAILSLFSLVLSLLSYNLDQAGFIVDDVWLVPRPTVLPAGTGMRGWLSTFTQAFLNAIPEESSNGTTRCKTSFVRSCLPFADEFAVVRTVAYVRRCA